MRRLRPRETASTKREAGTTVAQIIEELPDLDEEDVPQALGYAAALRSRGLRKFPRECEILLGPTASQETKKGEYVATARDHLRFGGETTRARRVLASIETSFGRSTCTNVATCWSI